MSVRGVNLLTPIFSEVCTTHKNFWECPCLRENLCIKFKSHLCAQNTSEQLKMESLIDNMCIKFKTCLCVAPQSSSCNGRKIDGGWDIGWMDG